ncbi:MAG: hypothetical protein H7Z42_19640 [Roseiflexaceae bacterium]|nr:hypothetical protein [Roseiflexaceae bacterium]
MRPARSAFAKYQQRVLRHLRALPPEQRAQIAVELESHLEDAAQASGLPADDPQLQWQVISKLGPSWRLGRALARANGVRGPLTWTLLLGAAATPLIQLLLLGAGLFVAFFGLIPEDDAEGLAVITMLLVPCLALPAVLASHHFIRQTRPWLSRLMVALGGAGFLGGAIYVGVTVFSELTGTTGEQFNWLAPLLLGLLACAGFWPLLFCLVTMQRHRDEDAAVAVMGVAVTIAWLLLWIGALISGLTPASAVGILMTVFSLFGIVLCQVIWLPLLSAWLWQQARATPVSITRR